MSFNKAATYHQMVGFLRKAGYDVSKRNIDESKTSFIEMDRLDLLRYAAALEATYEARTENMDGNAILEELDVVNTRLAGYQGTSIPTIDPIQPEAPVDPEAATADPAALRPQRTQQDRKSVV